jgi:hypothetical protein
MSGASYAQQQQHPVCLATHVGLVPGLQLYKARPGAPRCSLLLLPESLGAFW